MYVLQVAKAAAWILNLLQTIISPGLFCCLHIGALKAEALVGRILPVQQVELCAAAAASRDVLLPPSSSRKCCVLMLGCNSGGHISLLCWGIGNLDQGGVTQVMTLSSTAFNLLLVFINRIKSQSQVSVRSGCSSRVRVWKPPVHPFLWELRAQLAAKHL